MYTLSECKIGFINSSNEVNKMLVETITMLILDGATQEAKAEIKTDREFSNITGKPRQLNNLQERDLLQAVIEAELGI